MLETGDEWTRDCVVAPCPPTCEMAEQDQDEAEDTFSANIEFP
jgi:hypothetical protein